MPVNLTYKVQKLVESALRKITVTDPGAKELEEGLDALNQLIATLMADKDHWIQNLVPVTGFTSLDDDFDVPVEYFNPLACNLAVVLAPEYGFKVSPEIAAMAKYSTDIVKLQNYRAMGRRIPSNNHTF